MVEVVRKEKETSDALVKRFSRRVQGSKKLNAARKNRFHKKAKTKRQQKQTALYKEKLRKVIDKYKKLGLFSDDKLGDIKRKMELAESRKK